MKLILAKLLPAKKDDIFCYCLILVTLLPIIYLLFDQKHSYMVLNYFALIIFAAVFIFLATRAVIKKQKITIFKSKAFIILTVMYLLMFMSTFFAYNQVAAWLGFYRGYLCELSIFQYIFYYVVAVVAINMKKENIIYLLNLVLVVSSIIIIAQFVKQDYHYGFVNRNHTGFYLSITTMLAVGLFLYSKNVIKSIVLALVMIMHFISLSLNSSFGPMVGVIVFFVLGLIYILIHKREILLKFIIVLVCFLSVVAFFDYVPKARELKCEPETTIEKIVGVSVVVLNKAGIISDAQYEDFNVVDGSDGWGRLAMWQRCLENMKERPIFGIGVASWKSYNTDMRLQTPHNEFLQYGTFAGIPCLLAYLVLIFYLFIKFRKNHKNMSSLLVIIFGALLVYLVQSIFGSVMPFTAPLFYIILGLAIKGVDFSV